MNKAEILVIDDEEPIRKLLDITLQANNYAVTEAATAKEGVIMASNHPPDLILLDLGLPDNNGLNVLIELRQWFTNPIIILSVQNSEEVIIHALDSGANDFLPKPFRTGELVARIRSALRTTLNEDTNTVITCNDLEIDLNTRTVKKNSELIKLTGTEYNLLSLFARND